MNETYESHGEDFAVGALIATPVARVSVSRWSGENWGFFRASADPVRVEVTDVNGSDSIPIIDWTRRVEVIVRLVMVAAVVGFWLYKKYERRAR